VWRPDAQRALSRSAVALPLAAHAPSFPGRALDRHEHDGHAGCGRDDDQRGSFAIGRGSSIHNLVFGRSVADLTMMQSYASAAKLLGGGPILETGFKTMICFG